MTAALRLVPDDAAIPDIASDTVPPPKIEWVLIAAGVGSVGIMILAGIGALTVISWFL